MIAYIDSSVLLRVALKQKDALKEFSKIKRGITSRLLKAECLRSLDRLVSNRRLKETQYDQALEFVFEALDYLEIISISEDILDRVGQPLGLNLGTLDAIHLFSASLWRLEKDLDPVFLTHDAALGRAARIIGLQVLGID